jgi:pyridoxamine 5'-phosphate oxidase
MGDLHAARAAFMAAGLSERDLAPDPVTQFHRWFDEVDAVGLYQPDAMVVSSVAHDGTPSSRYVLLRGVDDDGFRFFTGGESQKATELDANPHAALLFTWHEVSRQVRITGPASRLTDEAVDRYFAERPRGSQIATVASHQSQPVADRATLDSQYVAVLDAVGDGPIDRPLRWTGYAVRPVVVEFWQGREFRFHDRLRYRRAGDTWTVERLQP